jgi:transposase, IS30 family
MVIAARLGRSPSTISRELARSSHRAGRDRASSAHVLAHQRASRPKPAKRVSYLLLRKQAEAELTKLHSPEQIVGRLREDYPNQPEMWVSTETIYQSLYVQSRDALRRDLTACLRTGRAMRVPKRQGARRKNRVLPDMVNISQRPAALLVPLTEGYRADQVAPALAAKIQTLPTQLRRSLTWDQGVEVLDWKQVQVSAEIAIYFCDPHSPWQRATNENTASAVLPEGHRLSVHNEAHLDAVATQLNDPPRNAYTSRSRSR